jgi:hypothetical protein
MKLVDGRSADSRHIWSRACRQSRRAVFTGESAFLGGDCPSDVGWSDGGLTIRKDCSREPGVNRGIDFWRQIW